VRAFVPAGKAGDWVTFDDVAEPDPRHNEAVTQVAAVSVNRGETFVLERPSPGWRPDKDIAGPIVRAAADGTGPQIGERVVGHPDEAGWAERAAIPVHKLAVIPDAVSFEQASAIPLAGLTALRISRAAGQLASRRVLMTGASGGVGHYLVELAAAQGAQVTVVTRTLERGARLRELGAHELLAHVEDAEGRFDVGLDSVGGSTTEAVLTRLTDHGLLIWFGRASRTPATIDFSPGRAAPTRRSASSITHARTTRRASPPWCNWSRRSACIQRSDWSGAGTEPTRRSPHCSNGKCEGKSF
jgi:NADPH2:quinone reductase